MDFLDVLRARLQARLDERSAIDAELEAVLTSAEAENRDLSDVETSQWSELRSSLEQADAEIETIRARIAEVEQVRERRAQAEQLAAQVNAAAGRPAHTPVVRVGEEPRTYNPDAERRGISFLRDLAVRHEDPAAADRIARHAAEARVDYAGYERRDVGTGAFSGLTVPQYLTDLVAPYRRAGRPTADICNRHPLPASGMTVNISRVTTGTAAAVQATETASVQETDLDDTLLTVHVRTIAGQQDVSFQAIDRSVGADSIVIADLVSAYNRQLDYSILNDDGTSGTHLGIRSTSSIVSVTYTDAAPTAADLYPKLADLVQQVQSGVYMGVSHFIMHPRRWWWIAQSLGTSFPFISIPGAGNQQAGSLGSTDYSAGGHSIFGVPVVLDANIPTNISSTQDVILGVTADELHLWEDPNAPLMIRAEQPGAGNLMVKFVVYGYSAFTAGRYPGAHGVISGTGLTTPTFAGTES